MLLASHQSVIDGRPMIGFRLTREIDNKFVRLEIRVAPTVAQSFDYNDSLLHN
jgi:hypothetical protein